MISEKTGEMEILPVMRPMLPSLDKVSRYLTRLDESRTYSNFGPLVMELETQIALRCRVDPTQVVAAANATIALEGVCHLAPVDEFCVPSFTFPATAHAVLRAGKRLSLKDIGEQDWQILVEPSISRGIIRVMPFGGSPELGRDEGTGYLIVDAAASLGAEPLDLSAIQARQCVVFSLHATKIFGAGEGGMAIFGSSEEASRFRTWTNFGFAGSRDALFPATNGKMSEISAAYGLAALADASREVSEWRIVNEKAADLSAAYGISSLVNRYPGVSPYWIVQLPRDTSVDHFQSYLRDIGIESRRWWGRGCHQMPAFQTHVGSESFPGTDEVSAQTLGLPMIRDLTSEDFKRIERALNGFQWL